MSATDNGGDGGRKGGGKVGIRSDRGRCCAEGVGERRMRLRVWGRLSLIIYNVLGHLQTRKLGLIIEGLSESLIRRCGGGEVLDGEGDLELRRRSLEL